MICALVSTVAALPVATWWPHVYVMHIFQARTRLSVFLDLRVVTGAAMVPNPCYVSQHPQSTHAAAFAVVCAAVAACVCRADQAFKTCSVRCYWCRRSVNQRRCEECVRMSDAAQKGTRMICSGQLPHNACRFTSHSSKLNTCTLASRATCSNTG